jgi:hypothetical protein
MMRSAADEQCAALGADSRKRGQQSDRRARRSHLSDVTTRLCRSAAGSRDI